MTSSDSGSLYPDKYRNFELDLGEHTHHLRLVLDGTDKRQSSQFDTSTCLLER